MDYVDIDLHKTSSQICTLGEGGALTERLGKTTRAAFDEVFAGKLPARILIEASIETASSARNVLSTLPNNSFNRSGTRSDVIRKTCMLGQTLPARLIRALSSSSNI